MPLTHNPLSSHADSRTDTDIRQSVDTSESPVGPRFYLSLVVTVKGMLIYRILLRFGGKTDNDTSIEYVAFPFLEGRRVRFAQSQMPAMARIFKIASAIGTRSRGPQ